jgi:hypothetical protein
MSNKPNLDNYETVKSRKKRFYGDHPDGRIVVEAVDVTESMAIFKATIFKNADDQRQNLAWSTGYAQEFKGIGGFANKTSWCENCEESAVGRALDNAGYAGNDKCSREEMQKVERAESALRTQEIDKLDRQIAFGKYKGKTWREAASDPGFSNWVEWAVSEEQKKPDSNKYKKQNLELFYAAKELSDSTHTFEDNSDQIPF